MSLRKSAYGGLLFLIMMRMAVSSAEDATPERVTLTIRAVTESGEPVPDAEVICVQYQDTLRTEMPRADERFTTNAQGLCTLDYTHHPGVEQNNFSLRIRKEQLFGSERVYPLNPQEPSHDIVLTPYSAMEGIVRDEEGVPIEGVTVGFLWFPFTSSDRAGRFRIERGGQEDYSLSLYKEDFEWCEVASMAGFLDVTLRRGVQIALAVENESGQRIPGATVSIRRQTLLADADGLAHPARFVPEPHSPESAWGRHEAEEGLWSGELRFKVAAESQAPYVLVLKQTHSAKRVDARKVLTPLAGASLNERQLTGRVVLAGRGKPVAAEIYMSGNPESFAYSAQRKGSSAADGAFQIERLHKALWYVAILPDEPTLYGVEGIVAVDLREQSIDGLVLTAAPGCAVEGKVVDPNVEGLSNAMVMLQQRTSQIRYEACEEDGTFRFKGLPPEPASVTLTYGQARIEVELPGPGQVRRDCLIEVPSRALTPPPDKVHIRVVDPEGMPQSGVQVVPQMTGSRERLPFGSTNVEGVYTFDLPHSGEITLEVNRYRKVVLGDYNRDFATRHEILEGAHFQATSDGAPKAHTIVVKPIDPAQSEPAPITLRIVDDQGNNISASIDLYTATSRVDTQMDHQGDRLYLHSLPDEPFIIEIRQQGYQSRVLQSGIDFERGDREIQVTLKKGPYTREESIWEAVTGRPSTEEEVSRTLQSEYIRRNETLYRNMAGPLAPRPAAPPVAPVGPPPPPAKVRIAVVNAKGEPIDRILVYRRSLADTMPAEDLRVESVQPDTAAGVQVLTADDGHYLLDNWVILSAEGMCRQWIWVGPGEGRDKTHVYTLYPARRLTIRVVDGSGNPIPDLVVVPARGHFVSMSSNYGSAPKTNAQGHVTMEGLPPGQYAYLVTRPPLGLPQPQEERIVYAELLPERDTVVELVYPPYAAGSPEALLARLEKRFPEYGSADKLEAAIAVLDGADREKLGDRVAERLAAVGDLFQENRRDTALLVRIAGSLELKKAAPSIRRLITGQPDGSAMGFDSLTLQDFLFALTDIEGDKAVDFLGEIAQDERAHPNIRFAALVGLGHLGSKKSVAMFASLRDAAFDLPGAPQPREAYTHGEKMIEALSLSYLIAYGPERAAAISIGFPQVDPDYASGTLGIMHGQSGGGTNFHLKRFGAEWLPVMEGSTVMP